MRMLRLRAYCDPEQTAGAHLDNDLSEAIAANNIICVNYTPIPTRGIDKETAKKYKRIKHEKQYSGHMIIHRFWMISENHNLLIRAIRYLCCNLIEYHYGKIAKNIDVVFSSSTPPTQGMLSAIVAKRLSKKYKRKVPFVYNLQDIFPDSLVNAGMTKKGSMIWKIGRKIEDYTYKNADKIIVISNGFKKNIIAKGVPESKIVVIPNWIDTSYVYPVDRKDNVLFDRYNLDRDKFYVCYSGNIGHSQNFGLLLKAAIRLKKEEPDVCFVIIGDGAAKNKFMNAVEQRRLNNIVFLPFQPYEDIAHVFSLGDVGLVISKSGIGRSSVPSKTWSIMAAETPILASFDKDSELSILINSVNCGIMTSTSDYKAFINDIIYMKNKKEEIQKMGIVGRKTVCTYFSKDRCVNKYIDVIKNL